jgi:hypothetical protein
MSKFIRLDEDHFAYLVERAVPYDQVNQMREAFEAAWPGKRMLVMLADEFIDLTGRYELVPIPEGME